MLVFGIPRSWAGNKSMAADVFAGLKDAVPSVIRGPEHEQALHERQAGRGMKSLGNAEAAGAMERKAKTATMAP